MIAKTSIKKLAMLVMIITFGIIGTITLTHSSAAFAAQTGDYNATTPTRLYDSRVNGTGKPLPADKERVIHILGGYGMPQTGVSAVMLNITAVPNGTRGNLSAYASDGARPSDGMLYFGPTQPVATQVLVPIGPDGSIKLYTNASTDVVIDAQGWVGNNSSAVSNLITSVGAYRVLSTRSGLAAPSRPATPKDTITLKVAGVGAVPATATAVVLNLAAISPTSNGSIFVKPTGSSIDPLAALTVSNGQNVANQVVVPVGQNGSITINSTVAQADIIAAAEGYYGAGSSSVISAKRILNTVANGVPLAKDENRKLQITGQYGVPAGAQSVTVHITASAGAKAGLLRAMPFGSVPADYNEKVAAVVPSTALLFGPQDNISNTVTVPLGPDGSIGLTSTAGPVDVRVDVLGWAMPPPSQVSTPTATASICASTPANVPSDTQTANQILNNTNKYAMTTWWAGDAVSLLKDPLTNASARGSTDPVRRLSMEAFSLATSLSTCAYNPAITGVSKDVATARAVQLISYVASHHVANKVDGWGGGWQGGLWTGYAGRAAWLLWGSLPSATQTQVARMVHFEADDSAGKYTDYLRAADGTYIRSPGDTGAEDTSWWQLPMQLATVMFPNDAHTPIWKYTYVKNAIAAWSRPADNSNTTVVSGLPVASWINGSNVEANGIVYNHQRVAPDYSTNMYQTFDDVWVQALAGKSAPRADITMERAVYDAFTTVQFSGKTIYMPGSATIYYPQGIDWGNGQQLPYALVDLQAATYGTATNVQQATQYEQLHQQAELAMQNRFTDGRTYANDAEYNYAGREEHTAQLAAQFYLTAIVRDNNLSAINDLDYSIHAGN